MEVMNSFYFTDIGYQDAWRNAPDMPDLIPIDLSSPTINSTTISEVTSLVR